MYLWITISSQTELEVIFLEQVYMTVLIKIKIDIEGS